MPFRAIIGVSAVLAGVAVLERSVDASAGPVGGCRGSEAYALLQPGERIDVRTESSPEAAVVGSLGAPAGGTAAIATIVTLDASQSGWARIVLASPNRFGWRSGHASAAPSLFTRDRA